MPAQLPLELAVLGPLHALRDGRPLALGGPRQQAVLAVLLSARSEPVPAARLVTEVWADEPASGSRSTLAAYVSRLRRLLPEVRITGSSGGAYCLQVDAEHRDDHRFAAALDAGRRALDAGRTGAALEHLVGGLDLWRGEAYAGLSCPALVLERDRLAALRRLAREQAAAARLQLGDVAEAAGELAVLVAEDPRRVEAVGLLARALAASGQQAQALAVLETALRTAGPAHRTPLLAVQQQLLTPAVTGPPSVPQPVRPPPRGAHRVPSMPLSSFVGRQRDLVAVTELLSTSRLVTLVGSGGAGKTRAALELVRSCEADDVAWVGLAPLRDPALVAPALEQAVAVPLAGERRSPPALVVVDNAEHLRAEVAGCVAALLGSHPGSRVLVTSRVPLGVPAERVVELLPLPVREGDRDGAAVQLFLDRVREVVHRWEPSPEDLAAVRRVCRELDGLPLALELAAAQCQALAPVDVAEALADRFSVLVRTGPSPVPHHRTLEAAIAWSYDLLAEPEQEAFRALAVFAGGFDLEAAREVLGPDAARTVADLAALSLLTVDRDRRPRRYGVLESLRAFAVARWTGQEAQELPELHAAWVARLAARAATELLHGDAAGWLRRLELELPNVRAAVLSDLRRGRVERAAATTADLSWFWYRRRHTAVGLELLEATAAAAPPGPDLARLLNGLSHLQSLAGDLGAALQTARAAVDAAEASGSPVLVSNTQSTVGWMLALVGEHQAAQEHAERGRCSAARSGDAVAAADSELAAALVAYLAGDLPRTVALLERVEQLAATARHAWCASQAAWLAAKAALRAGEPDRAVRQGAALVARAHAEQNAVLTLAGALVVAVGLSRTGAPEQGARLLGALLPRVQDRLEHVDPLDGPAYGAEVQAALPRSVVDRCTADGAGWDEEALLAAVAAVAAPAAPVAR